MRRATLGRDHVQGELDRLTRVVRSQNLGITANQITISTDPNTNDDDVTYEKERNLVDAYLSARGNVVSAANKVQSAVRSLDSANRALQGKLQDPDSYLNQLVTLREYQQVEAMNALEEAGGDDALQSFKDAVAGRRQGCDGGQSPVGGPPELELGSGKLCKQASQFRSWNPMR